MSRLLYEITQEERAVLIRALERYRDNLTELAGAREYARYDTTEQKKKLAVVYPLLERLKDDRTIW